MSEKLPPPSDAGASEFEREMQIAREAMVRRREALRQLALGEAIMDEDRDSLSELSKKIVCSLGAACLCCG